MTHDMYRDLIQRELDDDLSIEETASLDRHTAVCAECRTEREEYRQLALGLRSMKAVVPERSFVSQMEFDFDELLRPQPQVTPLQKKGRRLPTRWWQGLSVAAAVVLAIGFTAHYLPGSSSQTAEPGSKNGNGSPVALINSPETNATPNQNGTGTTAQTNPASGNSSKEGNSTAGTTAPDATGSSAASGTSAQKPAVVAMDDSASKQLNAKADALSVSAIGSSGHSTSGSASSGHSTSGTASSMNTDGHAANPEQPNSSATSPSISSTENGNPARDAAHSGGSTGPVVPDTGHSTGLVGATKPQDPHTGLVAEGTSTAGMAPALQDRDHAYGLVAGALSAERPPLPLIVGFVQQKPSLLSEKLQAQVRTGDTSVRWATVPVQVVQHVLTDIGFAPTAVVTATKYPDRVNVQQAGQEFIVKLSQPFDSGTDGIWQPVQISRALSPTSQEPTDKPILAYFAHLQSINPVKFSNIQVEESLFMGRTVVGVDMTSYTPYGEVENRLAFSFRLRLNGDYSWSLDGTPTIRH